MRKIISALAFISGSVFCVGHADLHDLCSGPHFCPHIWQEDKFAQHLETKRDEQLVALHEFAVNDDEDNPEFYKHLGMKAAYEDSLCWYRTIVYFRNYK